MQGEIHVKIGTPLEVFDGEARVAMTPDSALQLQKLGFDCFVEKGAGVAAGFSDEAYSVAGVEIVGTAAALWKSVDVVAKVRPPNDTEAKRLKSGQTLISFFWPAQNKVQIDLLAKKRRQCHRNGYGAADKPRPKDGCSLINGQYCWLSSGN